MTDEEKAEKAKQEEAERLKREAEEKAKKDAEEKAGEGKSLEELRAELADTKAKLKAVNAESAERRRALAEADKKREADEQARLAEQGQYKELADKLKTQVADAEKQMADLQTAKSASERYEKALKARADAEIAKLPEVFKPLLAKLDPVEQLEWLAANADKIASGKSGVPKSPNGAEEKELSEEQKQEARASATRQTHSIF